MADETIKTFTPRFKLRFHVLETKIVSKTETKTVHKVPKKVTTKQKVTRDKTVDAVFPRVLVYVSEPDAPTKLLAAHYYQIDPEGYAVAPDDPDNPATRLELPAAAHTFGFHHAHGALAQKELDKLPAAQIDVRKLTAKDATAGTIYLRSCAELASKVKTVGVVPILQIGTFGGEPPPHNKSVKMEGIVYRSGLKIDADGAPNAYHPQNIADALDYLGNAGHGASDHVKKVKGKPVLGPDKKTPVMQHVKADWWALAKDKEGTPYVQTSGEFAGYHVTMSAIGDGTKADSDVTKWVDAREVAYISIPRPLAARKGNLCFVYNAVNQTYALGIVADVGPPGAIGEASIKMADLLGTFPGDRRRDAKKDAEGNYAGVDGRKVGYVVFPGTAAEPKWPVDDDTIQDRGGFYFTAWGGFSRLMCCLPELFPATEEPEPADDANPASTPPPAATPPKG